jgi:hypothetical protein
MRHATWLRLEASPFWHELYRQWRRLPDGVRAPLRVLLVPHWHFAAFMVRAAARNRVVAGPFRGMKIRLSGLSSRHLLGYILGSQELELRDVVNRIIGRGYGTILNIGAADGYYAVGFALRLPSTQVEAFEALPELHPLIEKSAQLNGVSDRVALRGKCDPDGLRIGLQGATAPTLVLMDVEGAEMHLLDPLSVPELRHSDILVETHDGFIPHVTDTLIERFIETHHIECYTAQPRILADFPADFLPRFRQWFPGLAVELMNERRAGIQRWLFLSPKDAHGQTDIA